MSETAVSQVPEKILYRPNSNKQIYFDKNGEMFNVENTITTGNISSSQDFSYGTGVVEQNRQYAILNYKGEVIVDFNTYSSIQSTPYNFIAKNENSKNILLDKNGNRIGSFEYDLISQIGNDTGIYSGKNYSSNKNDIFTATGCYLGEVDGDSLNSNVNSWTDDRNFIAVWLNNSDVYVVDKTNFEKKLDFRSNNIGVGLNYITDIANNVTYIFDNQGNSLLELKDCLIKDDATWNANKSIYRGCNIENYTDTSGYLIYDTNNNNTKMLYKDGTTICEYPENDFPTYYMGQNYVFVNNSNNADVYNQNQKITTVQNRNVLSANVLRHETEAQNQIIPLYSTDNSNMRINLYNQNGELVNNNTYIRNGNSGTVLALENGTAKVKPLANGELMDAKDYTSIELLIDENKENEYSNNYFIAMSYDSSNNDKYYLIDKEGNKITELNYRDITNAKLYEENGIFIYTNLENTSSVYNLNERKEILKGGSKSTYVKDFNIVLIGSSTISPDYVYSLTQKQLYKLSEM